MSAGREGQEVRRMRAGVAARLRRAGGELRELTPAGWVAVLSAGALGPVAGAAEGAAEGPLADVVAESIDGLRRHGRSPADAQDEFEDALAGRIEAALAAGDDRARALLVEIAAVLREIGAGRAALEYAIDSGDQELHGLLTAAFIAVSSELDDFRFLLTEVGDAAEEIQRSLLRQDAEQGAGRERSRWQSVHLALLREELMAIERRIRPAGGDSARWHGGSPYRGLYPFQEDHAEIFYGREGVTARLVGRLGERLTRPGMMMVTGPSGAGKSSLLRAGLIPALARGLQLPGSADWPRLVITPGGTPLRELAVHLAGLMGADPTVVQRTLTGQPQQAHLAVREALEARARAEPSQAPPSQAVPRRLVLVVDQFEEIFTSHGRAGGGDTADAENERQAFVAVLHAAAITPCGPDAEPPALVVIGVRSDFWDRCAAYPQFAEAIQDGQVIVEPMTEAELRLAVTGPAAMAGLQIETGLVEVILSELRPDRDARDRYPAGALPLLSQALRNTWDRRANGRLTIRGYEQSGRVRDAVQLTADEVFQRLSAQDRKTALRVFRRMTVIAPGGQMVRRRAALTDIYAAAAAGSAEDRGQVNALLAAFADKRLLTLHESTVEIAHDALLTAWPTLRQWLEPDLTTKVLYDRLIEDAAEWKEHHQDAAYLYRGGRLVAIHDTQPRWDRDTASYPPPGPTVQQFLNASTRAAAKRIRQRRLALATLIALLFVTGASAVVATRQTGTARHQRDLATARALVARSDHLADSDPALSRLLAVAAWRLGRLPEARAAMLAAARRPGLGVLPRTTVTALSFSPDGNTLATGSSGVHLWDVNTRHQTGTVLPDTTRSDYAVIGNVVFSPDRRTFARVTNSGTKEGQDRIETIDMATRRPSGAPLTESDPVVGMAFSRDGKTLAVSTRRPGVRLWDLGTRKPVRRLASHPRPIMHHLAFSPDGDRLVAAGIGDRDEDTTRLWDLTKRAPPDRPLVGHRGVSAMEAVFSPDGKFLATAETDGRLRLWDATTGKAASGWITGHKGTASTVAFSPDGKILASGGEDRTVRLWSLESFPLWPEYVPPALGEPLAGHTDGVDSMTFSPDGTTLATGSALGDSVRLWAVTDRDRSGRSLTGSRFGVPEPEFLMATAGVIAFSPDGRTMAATALSQLAVFDVATGKPTIRPLTAHKDQEIHSVAFSRDGNILATAGGIGREGVVRLWDAKTGKPIGKPLSHSNVRSVAFSPDGKTLVSGGDQPSPRFWDPAAGRPIDPPIGPPPDTAAVRSVAFSPDGKIVATAGVVTRLWDATTHRQLGNPLRGHNRQITSVAFSPDGKILATGSHDGTVRLWNLATRSDATTPLILADLVSSMAFSPDGTTLATRSFGQNGRPRVQLWDVSTGRHIAHIALTGQVGESAVFSPDGKTLAATNIDDAFIRLYDMTFTTDFEQRNCALAGRSLTRQEWRQYIAVPAYQEIC